MLLPLANPKHTMNTRSISLFLLAVVVGFSALPASAQEWITYESETFDLQFNLPAGWETEVDGETLTATGAGIVFVLTAVKDASISTAELFEIQVETLDMEADGEYEEIELRGGILGVLGSGAGVIEEEVVGMILLAATLDENNYLAYIFALPETFDYYQDTMVEVITSLAPLGWVDE